MQKTICKVTYDTDTAEIVKKITVGEFGSNTGYEEILYKTADDKYFIYTNGGADSKYPIENIARLAKNKVEDWLNEHK